MFLRGDEDEKAVADRTRDPPLDGNGSFRDPLNDRSHRRVTMQRGERNSSQKRDEKIERRTRLFSFISRERSGI
jgi:hypothetical protein